MSDNKYYTPSIEEFHVGFEFEIAQLYKNWHIIGWDRKAISINNILLRISNYPNLYRVKYLDREDIESFGFIEDTDASPIENVDHIKFEKHRFDKNGRLMNLEFTWMWLNDQPFILLSECEENSEDDFEILFQGYCKNKSQLKMILQWTGILK